MKKIICEMCGSTDLIKENGFFVCQNCGIKYSSEEVKKLMLEGNVQVSGSVEIEGTVKTESNSSRKGAFLCMLSAISLWILPLVLNSSLVDKNQYRQYEILGMSFLNYIVIFAVIPLIIIIFSIIYLKIKNQKNLHNSYGVIMFILSILLLILIMKSNGICVFFIIFSPIICFLGSILVLTDSIRGN